MRAGFPSFHWVLWRTAMARLHWLGPEGFSDASAFVSELTAHSFAVVAHPVAPGVRAALAEGLPEALGFQRSSKVQGQKARTQLRRVTAGGHLEAFEVMEQVGGDGAGGLV